MTDTRKHIADGIYRDPRTANLYHRPVIRLRRTWRKLDSSTLTMARKEMAVLRTRQIEHKYGVAPDPYAALVTIGQIAKVWIARDCPDRHGRARAGESLKAETARVTRLLPFWKARDARSINAEDCRDYQCLRTATIKNKKFSLGRSVDAELTTLSNLLTWAAQNPRKTGLRTNPIATGRPRFDDPALTRHCTAVMPKSDESMHQLATYLLASDRSRPLGWQLLLEALTGARTSEILACRVDADTPRQPGYQDGSALHLHRKKKGIEPWALLEVVAGYSPLADCLAAFRNWHARRYPRAKYPGARMFIPGRGGEGSIDRASLSHALRRACKELALPSVTSHGLRAYFVRTLRALGVDDSEIAKRLGHRSGVSLVERTYGITEPGWFGSKKQDFLPDGFEPAWAPWVVAVRKDKIVKLAGYHLDTRTDKTKRNGGTRSKPVKHRKPLKILAKSNQ